MPIELVNLICSFKFKHIKNIVMKLKKILWFGMLLLPVFACDNSDETLETAANIELSIPLISNEVDINLKSNYFVSGYATFCLGKKENVTNCPIKVLNVSPESGAVLKIPMPSEINTISNLVLNWSSALKNTDQFKMLGSVEIDISQAEILERSLSFNLDQILIPLITNLSTNPNSYFKIEITGITSTELSSTATIEIPIIVEHENLSIRFGVF